METRMLALLTVLVGLGGKAAAEEPFLPGELVEVVDADTIVVRCDGVGESPEAAARHARLGCLRWYAEGLAQSPAEEAALGKLWPALAQELDRFVDVARPGSRDGRGVGVRSMRPLEGDRYRVALNAKLRSGALKKRMEEGGALAPLPAGGPRTVVLPAAGEARPEQWAQIRAELVPFLMRAGCEVLEEPPSGDPAGVDLVVRVSVARKDGAMGSVQFVIALEAVAQEGKKVIATASVPGMSCPAERDASCLSQTLGDAAGRIQEKLEAHHRGGGGADR